MGRQIKGMMRNIGQSQRGIGDVGKETELESEEQQRQLKRKKKKSTRKTQDLENKQKIMTMKWEILEIHTMNCEKSLGQEILRERQCHDLAKQLSHYLYFFSFLLFYFLIWTYYTRKEYGKVSHDKCHISQVTC